MEKPGRLPRLLSYWHLSEELLYGMNVDQLITRKKVPTYG